jgi:hypothetical protein
VRERTADTATARPAEGASPSRSTPRSSAPSRPTSGSRGRTAHRCDAIFEAYDDTDELLGTKTALQVGDANNLGGVAEDRFFAVVHAAGVKKIVVKSSAGGVEVDHLTYGR